MFFILTMVAAPFSDSGTYLHSFPKTQGLKIYTSDNSGLQCSKALVFLIPNYLTSVSAFSCQFLYENRFSFSSLPVRISVVNFCCYQIVT